MVSNTAIESVEWLDQVVDMVAGSVSGAVCRVVEYPLDTCKVLSQTNIGTESSFKLIKDTYSTEGLLRFYRGIPAPLLGTSVEFFLTFWMFGYAERKLKSNSKETKLPLPQIAVCGGFSGIGSGLWVTPVEFVKCQMQSPFARKHYRSSLDCFLSILRRNPRMLACGLNASLLRQVPGYAIYFAAYKGSLRTLSPNSDNCPLWMYVTSGGLAGFAYWLVMYPIDLGKSVLQSQVLFSECSAGTGALSMNVNVNVSLFRLLQTRYRMNGVRSLYAGFGVTIPRAFLANAALFSTFELVKGNLNLQRSVLFGSYDYDIAGF